MKYVIAILTATTMIACKGNSDKSNAATGSNSYTVKGTLQGVDTGFVYLYKVEQGDEDVAIDSIKVQNGNFEFKGEVSDPQFTLLGFKQDGQKFFPLAFFLEAGTTTINGSRDSLNRAVVKGQGAQREYDDFKKKLEPLSQRERKLYDEYQASGLQNNPARMEQVQQQHEQLQVEKKELVLQYANEHPSSRVAIVQLAYMFLDDVNNPALQRVFSKMDTSVQRSYYGRRIAKALEAQRQTGIGSAAPDFTLKDPAGKDVSLSSFRGKYVLIDFWASWCRPCREENPNVVKAYKAYHPKGFDIVGVSLDNKKERWEDAIREDQLAWTHVSDLKGWRSEAAALYGVNSIPMNFLLDKEGRIIGKDLRGQALSQKLESILK